MLYLFLVLRPLNSQTLLNQFFQSGANLSELLEKVSTIARRLDTCMLISGSATTVTHWIEFPKYDLAISCLNHIQRVR